MSKFIEMVRSNVSINSAQELIGYFIVIAMSLPTILVYLNVLKPYIRGFYCQDTSINYPYKSDTISPLLLVIICVILPILIIIPTEVIKAKKNETLHIRKIIKTLCFYIRVYFTGAMCDQLFVNLTKVSVGRLRPCFFALCRPNFLNLPCNNFTYIILNDTIDCHPLPAVKPKLFDARMSFPSGHSSLSMFTAIFLVIYMYKRWYLPSIIKLLQYTLTIVLLLLALLCGISRVNDFKHHPTDVIGGFFSGFFSAFLVWLIITPTKMDIPKKQVSSQLSLNP